MANSNKAWQYQTLATQTLTSLFWGLKNGTASLENNLAISLIGTHKKKKPYDAVIQHPGITHKKYYVYTKVCMWIFTAPYW